MCLRPETVRPLKEGFRQERRKPWFDSVSHFPKTDLPKRRRKSSSPGELGEWPDALPKRDRPNRQKHCGFSFECDGLALRPNICCQGCLVIRRLKKRWVTGQVSNGGIPVTLISRPSSLPVTRSDSRSFFENFRQIMRALGDAFGIDFFALRRLFIRT